MSLFPSLSYVQKALGRLGDETRIGAFNEVRDKVEREVIGKQLLEFEV